MKRLFKKIYIIAFSAIFMLALSACSDDFEPALDIPTGPVIRITTGSTMTRANDGHYPDDIHAEDHEEALHRVSLFFFTDESSVEGAFMVEELEMDEQTTADIRLKIPVEQLANFSDITATSARGYVYVLVNLPEDVKVDTKKRTINGEEATLEQLHHTWVSEPGFVAPGLPDDFVMRGSGDVEVKKEDNLWLASGYVPLERLAAKVRLLAELPEKIYIDLHGNTLQKGEEESEEDWIGRREEAATEIWEPAPMGSDEEGSMKLYFNNMATKGRIDANLDNRELLDYRNVDRRPELEEYIRKLHVTEATRPYYDTKYTYSHDIPYYSYPNRWESNTPSEEHQSTVILMMPWKRIYHKDHGDEGEFYQLCYYQVPVNALKIPEMEADCMKPNSYYRIKIRLGTLGNKDWGDPSQLSEVSYEVLGWANANVDIAIKDRRYLVVNQKRWTMNNIETLEVPFSTSHKTIVTGCYVTYFRYNDVWGYDEDAIPARGSSDATTYSFNIHDKSEFEDWLNAADDQLTNKREGEGLITLKNASYSHTNGNTNFDDPNYLKGITYRPKGDVLYYKKDYFYDKYYGGYRYYVGHEHPITFHPEKVTHAVATAQGDDKNWAEYESKYRPLSMDAIYTCTIDDDRSVINFRHPLIQWETVRNRDGEITHYKPMLNPRDASSFWDEFSRVEIVIKIRHEDWDKGDGLFEETVYITQYPGIYITVSHNYGTVSSNRNRGNEYVLVNGKTVQNASDEHEYDYIDPISNHYASNTNPNMYLIHTTQLSSEFRNKYVIGDPRTLYYNNYLSSMLEGRTPTPYDNSLTDSPGNEDINVGWTNYRWTEINSWTNRPTNTPSPINLVSPSYQGRTLSNYYPTDESTAYGKDRFIAPTFRMASSFGRTKVNGRVEMRRRCAAYQEAGRPAGRWRVPTKAEIEYVALLSADRKIPILYGSVLNPDALGYYWAASGGVEANSKGVVRDSRGDPYYTFGGQFIEGIMATRCVYDEWYWNQVDNGEFAPFVSGPKEVNFFWGDILKDNTQNFKLNAPFRRR